jgi:hypothetical protein
MKLRKVAGDGALAALTAARPGRPGTSERATSRKVVPKTPFAER